MDRFNLALDALEHGLGEPVDAVMLARIAHTSEHHFRRVFATLTGMGLAEYVRRRRMTKAAPAVVAADERLIDIAQRFGYDSADAFTRAFRAVHGVSPTEARLPGALLTSQARVVFHFQTEGRDPMRYRIETTPALRLVGWSARVPLVALGPNPAIAEFVASIPAERTIALKQLNDVAPEGVLAVTSDLDEDREDGTVLSYLHGVATTQDPPERMDAIAVPPSRWAVFTPERPDDETLQILWRDVVVTWLPANGWQVAPGPEIVAMRVGSDGALHRELWIPIEAAG